MLQLHTCSIAFEASQEALEHGRTPGIVGDLWVEVILIRERESEALQETAPFSAAVLSILYPGNNGSNMKRRGLVIQD